VLQSNDLGKLIVRLLIGIMMLFHGLDKIIHGINNIKYLAKNAGLPELIAYGVYAGEVVAPILIILGLYARIASLFLAINMSMAIYLAYADSIFQLGKRGAPVIELSVFYLVLSLAVFILGSGKYGINSK